MADDTQGIAGSKRDEDLKENPGIGQSEGAYSSGEALEDRGSRNRGTRHTTEQLCLARACRRGQGHWQSKERRWSIWA